MLKYFTITALLFFPGILLFCRTTSAVSISMRNDGLTSLVSHEGNFSAIMPVKPQRSVKKSKSRIGDLENYIYYCLVGEEKNDNYVFLISYVDYPGSMIISVNKGELMVNAVLGSMKKLMRPHIIVEKPILLQNHPGYEAIFTGYQQETGKLVMAKERIYLVNNRMYILLMMTEATNSHNIADRFFNSFQVTTNI